MTTLRTALQWLDEHQLSDDAECWVLTDEAVIPIVAVQCDGGDAILHTSKVFRDPLTYSKLRDTILADHSGGGNLTWYGNTERFYRGSYTVNPEQAVFFIYLPQNATLSYIPYDEQIEIKRQQARQLTQEIDNARDQR
jgi:hypothetical protein